MSNMRVKRIWFNRKIFKRKFDRNPMTYRELSEKSKVSEATIYKAVKEGCMSERTYSLLSSFVDIPVIPD